MTCRITDELLLSRAEHNDGRSLAQLEEISLHQQHLGRLEYVNRVCADLRILLLQDNCIAKIENLGRLRNLKYLNLAMNNVERVENLENCERLSKLDLTLNFVGELTSVESLRENGQLRELVLMGNPCCAFPGYRQFVVGALPQLRSLDGEEVTKSERIRALQDWDELRREIIRLQEEYLLKREGER